MYEFFSSISNKDILNQKKPITNHSLVLQDKNHERKR